MRNFGVKQWLTSHQSIMSMYTDAKTFVTFCGNSKCFEVKLVCMSPLLFVIVMEAISREFRVALPWEFLYADDLVVIAETEDDLISH